MFNPHFIDFDTSRIVQEIKVNGYFVFEKALTQEFVDELLKEVDFDQFLINTNNVGVVVAYEQKFLTHCLASSKKSYDVITSKKILDICKSYLVNGYKLTNHRIYQTCKTAHMPWHTDNNLQYGKQLSAKHDMPGLLFLFYLSDVTKNAFQFIKDSHLWSHRYDGEIYLDDSYIERKYQKDIATLLMKKGAIIVCDTHLIHRAEPFEDAGYTRKTLLFQVDRVGAEYVGHGENNLVNTEYLDNLTPEVMDYLGFGFPRNYPAFPNSSVATLTPQAILQLQKQLLPQTLQALSKSLLKTLLPAELIIYAKRLRWLAKPKTLIESGEQ
jgi:hypothetical protein